jgi:hypothetical protein
MVDKIPLVEIEAPCPDCQSINAVTVYVDERSYTIVCLFCDREFKVTPEMKRKACDSMPNSTSFDAAVAMDVVEEIYPDPKWAIGRHDWRSGSLCLLCGLQRKCEGIPAGRRPGSPDPLVTIRSPLKTGPRPIPRRRIVRRD